MNDKEYEQWYQGCEFIHKYMQFYSFEDFLERAWQIKLMYQGLEQRNKYLYRWYVYANHINYTLKGAIWDYLNGYMDYPTLVYYNRSSKFKQDSLEQRNNYENDGTLDGNGNDFE